MPSRSVFSLDGQPTHAPRNAHLHDAFGGDGNQFHVAAVVLHRGSDGVEHAGNAALQRSRQQMG